MEKAIDEEVTVAFNGRGGAGHGACTGNEGTPASEEKGGKLDAISVPVFEKKRKFQTLLTLQNISLINPHRGEVICGI